MFNRQLLGSNSRKWAQAGGDTHPLLGRRELWAAGGIAWSSKDGSNVFRHSAAGGKKKHRRLRRIKIIIIKTTMAQLY